MSKKNILWLVISTDVNLPSFRHRVFLNIGYFEDKYNVSYLQAPKNVREFIVLLAQIRLADMVIVQKELLPLHIIGLLKLCAKKIAYDFDDLVYCRLLNDGGCKISLKRKIRFAAMVSLADLVVAGSPYLKNKAVIFGGRRVVIVPTAVDHHVVERIKKENDVVNIGWIGTGSNIPYLEKLDECFKELRKKGFVFKLCVMANKPPVMLDGDIDFYPWSENKEGEFLDGIDIGIMPLPNNEHTRGKCAYKALQYMAYGKSVVASDVGVNAEWISDAGIIVEDSQGFFSALASLIENEELRNRLGKTGREIVAKKFDRRVVCSELLSVFESV